MRDPEQQLDVLADSLDCELTRDKEKIRSATVFGGPDEPAHVAVGMKLHGQSLMGPQPGLEAVFEEHSSIFEAIRDRDAEAARTAMRLHLETSRDRLFEGRLLDLSFR